MQGIFPVTGKMPVPQVLLLKWKHYIQGKYFMKIIFIVSLILNVVLIIFLLSRVYKNGYLGRLFVLLNWNYLNLPTDTLMTQRGWKETIKYQKYLNHHRQLKACFFGDSLLSELGSMGNDTFNFAISGTTTISLLEQMKLLETGNFQCQTAIVGIGTNDAHYRIMPEQFRQNLQQIIDIIKKKMTPERVIFIPAFYSNPQVMLNPLEARSIAKIDELNQIVKEIAKSEKGIFADTPIQPLFENKLLKATLTDDGIHLNLEGKKIYRKALLNLINPSEKGESVSPENHPN
jgi:lysophospholipase L1-like esterase